MSGRAYASRVAVGLAIAIAGSLAASSCGSTRGRLRIDAGLPASCSLNQGETRSGGDFRIAIPDTLHAFVDPFPGNDSEALLYRQLYEGLTLLGCDGTPLPALAESWSSDRGGSRWRFRLRDGACFWDGSPVQAADVIAAWLWAARRAGGDGRLFPDPLLSPLAQRVGLFDSLTIEIRPALPCADLPRRLAAPGYAVSAERPLLRWRIGTGPFRPRALHLPAEANVVCTPNLKHPSPPGAASLTFESGGGGRHDRMGSGADAILLRDPGSLRYYERREELRIVPLAWDRLYLLERAPGAPPSPGWLESLRGDLLAGDLLQGQARPVELDDLELFLPFQRGAFESRAGRALSAIYFLAGDPVARDLALRIAALLPGAAVLGGPDGWGVDCVALGRAELYERLDAILAGEEDAAALLHVDLGGSPARRLAQGSLTPVALTRPVLVALEDLGGCALDGWGGLHLRGLAHLAEEMP